MLDLFVSLGLDVLVSGDVYVYVGLNNFTFAETLPLATFFRPFDPGDGFFAFKLSSNA